MSAFQRALARAETPGSAHGALAKESRAGSRAPWEPQRQVRCSAS